MNKMLVSTSQEWDLNPSPFNYNLPCMDLYTAAFLQHSTKNIFKLIFATNGLLLFRILTVKVL